MLARLSPYARVAARLRDMGHHPMPVRPGEKVPGHFEAGRWSFMARWQEWCTRQPPAFLHETWEEWPDSGVCIAHGRVVGADVDTDRQEVAAAVIAALGPSPVRRRGQKGWMGYYRPGPGCGAHVARLRWVDADGVIIVELLLHGTQSVLPPTIHPRTGQPYTWLTPDTLEDTPLEDLPELPADAVARLDVELGKLGIRRDAPKRAERPAAPGAPAPASAHDLEKPRFRSLNDRAMAALDRWFPALGLPKSRKMGTTGLAVPAWRPSSSGRPLDERNPNLKAHPDGIVDWGGGDPHTPIDLVTLARGCGFDAAVEWLEQFVEPEPRADIDLDAIAAAADARQAASADRAEIFRDPIPPPDGETAETVDMDGWALAPMAKFKGSRPPAGTKPVRMPSAKQFGRLLPLQELPFPVAPDECPVFSATSPSTYGRPPPPGPRQARSPSPCRCSAPSWAAPTPVRRRCAPTSTPWRSANRARARRASSPQPRSSCCSPESPACSATTASPRARGSCRCSRPSRGACASWTSSGTCCSRSARRGPEAT
jgi:hypothetical protein